MGPISSITVVGLGQPQLSIEVDCKQLVAGCEQFYWALPDTIPSGSRLQSARCWDVYSFTMGPCKCVYHGIAWYTYIFVCSVCNNFDSLWVTFSLSRSTA